MSALLLQCLDIFEVRPLITNLNCKLSAVSAYDQRRQLLCLVSEQNDIVLRYTSENGQEVLKLVSWFQRNNRVVHDVSFDPTGTWLLVLCFDNTLHIVPALAVVDKIFADSEQTKQPFSINQITSYIIPFVGPHVCPNSKSCPNQSSCAATLDDEFQQLKVDNAGTNIDEAQNATIETFSHEMPQSMLATNTPAQVSEQDQTGNSQVLGSSFMVSKTCPYPLSVVWWQTNDGVNRAIIGYSDASICFVGLSPNCPFVASTSIENGSVVKLLICKDNSFQSVMLLITSSLKQQYKLLLEQTAIKYTYPGDISPSSAPLRDNDWQIVMPLNKIDNSNSNNSDPASDSSQPSEEPPPTVTSVSIFNTNTQICTSTLAEALSSSSSVTCLTTTPSYTRTSHLPPPPPYSVAINRHLDNSGAIISTAGTSGTSTVNSSGIRFQQQQLPADLDDMNSRAGIIPAARARLASLKSLGSKKLNAIKMRLSDNRQKLEEYMPDNNIGPFAIMDSPSLTPELLTQSSLGSYYTIQNLRSTYLLSALHSHSNSLSVHSIDINLKPLFLYKIPKNCFDILISSNLLYAIQYVNAEETEVMVTAHAENAEKQSTEINISQSQLTTEKEQRDTQLEKEEKMTDLSAEDDKLLDEGLPLNGSDSVDTSVTTSAQLSSTSCNTPSNMINAVSVISSAMASLRSVSEEFNPTCRLGLFRFEHETVLNLYQMCTYRTNDSTEQMTKEDKAKAFTYKDIRSPMDYVQFYSSAKVPENEEYSLNQMEIMQNEFPKINYDPCYVITNKNVYYIQLKKEPFAIFLEAALRSEWTQCREFCLTFDLSFEACIEFAGDFLLRRKKITQALLTYNYARIKPIRTALKLAMFGHTNALLHLCAMALKCVYILRSKYFCSSLIKSMLSDITYRHSEDVRGILPPTPDDFYGKAMHEHVNEGASCSDYNYANNESISNLQMSASSQFHLANLLLITLAERVVNDKNYLPLWNFLVSNNKYHTNMTSVVLCQSGLFSSALLLAKVRGVCLDVFLALTSVVGQEFGWYNELNVCLYNLSEPLFIETICYMPQVSIDYFCFIQERLEQIRPCVLKRLEQQLNPFSAKLRPIVSHNSSCRVEYGGNSTNDNNSAIFDFCKNLIETYLAVLIHMESQRSRSDRIQNALSTFRINYEDNQFAIESSRFKPISAGCAYAACVVDGVAYFWGSNGVPCNYSVSKSSEPPEPPHAVKSLNLLAQLNLEVHAVKCGRQHTLILTNNGLYAFGNNNLHQLGIGKHMQMTLQPMLVSAFDGKNITLLEAGQYHNAAVADGLLYTWGWGVYGQLGHGKAENAEVPKLVAFFKDMKVLQASLGHAHSLVLCQSRNAATTELYVFGSNHFGQLGLGNGNGNSDSNAVEVDCASQVKSLLPIKLHVSNSKIRLIHTKFFANLAIDDSERMYTWGSSPQALRLANQIKRRANAKQKIEELQRREMSKRFEATFTKEANNVRESEAATKTADADLSNVCELPNPTVTLERSTVAESQQSEVELEVKAELPKTSAESTAQMRPAGNDDEDDDDVFTNAPITEQIIHTEANAANLNIMEEAVEEEFVPALKPMETVPLAATSSAAAENTEETAEQKTMSPTQAQRQASIETDPTEHMSPHLVDTSEVAGQILQISSGLFHFALISSSCTLYTWGKNLEHQLGTEDRERRAIQKPSPIDSIDQPMFVECGADFTLVMTMDYVVKAFGGNSNGQCGRDLGSTLDKMKQRVVCLPTTKRLMRFESQCVDVPVEINLPRPRIRLDTEPVRYLKSIPKYRAHFVQEADINLQELNYEAVSVTPLPSQQQYKSSSENVITTTEGQEESDDMISSLENLSQNDASSLNISAGGGGTSSANAINLEQEKSLGDSSFCDGSTPEEQSYARLCDVKERQTQPLPLQSSISVDTETLTNESELQQLRHYIHYCLYVFHGLYNPDKMGDFSKTRLEYRIRTLMLNFQFIEAFQLCLQDCHSASKTLKLFEYFTKDTGYVPMRRQELKHFIYHLLQHFLHRKFDMLECERFLLADLDFYLLELAYVLYFNNNNTLLEQNLNQKFKNLIAQESCSSGGSSSSNNNNNNDNVRMFENLSSNQHQITALNAVQSESKLQDTDVIFDSLSIKFKTIVSQRLLKHCNSN